MFDLTGKVAVVSGVAQGMARQLRLLSRNAELMSRSSIEIWTVPRPNKPVTINRSAPRCGDIMQCTIRNMIYGFLGLYLLGSPVFAKTAAAALPDEIHNSLGMRLAYVAPRTFTMGSPKSEADRESQETAHEVELTKGFYVGKHEVTVGAFRKFVRATNYQTDAEKDGKGGYGVKESGGLDLGDKYNWKSPGFEQSDDHPVVLVSWNDAQAYCRWLSKKENKTYRLPTEAEWEYACRAGTRTAYSFGDDPQDLVAHGNVGRNKDGFRYTAPVGRFKPNRYGLYDMHGNVWEWCEDWYDSKGYQGGRETDPTGPDSAEARVHRGGGWSSSPMRCRSAARVGRHPSAYRGSYLGFRVLCIIKETGE